jgi:hypothetical protein
MASDQSGLRASHEDRDRAVETLRVAAGDGRLTAEELDTRVEAALSARTLGELAELTADLPDAAVAGLPAPKDLLVIEQKGGGQHVRTGPWAVPGRIELRTKICDVTLDFTDAVLTRDSLHIDVDMRLGKLIIIADPGIVIDFDDLALAFSKLKSLGESAADTRPRLRIRLTGTLRHGKLIERRPRRRRSGR